MKLMSFLVAALTAIAIPTVAALGDPNGAIPPKAPVLTSAAAIKQTWLVMFNPNQVSNLDRNVVRKRWVLAKKVARIHAGNLDVVFCFQAHVKNADAYRAVGDLAKAHEENMAASGLSIAAQMATMNEEAAYADSIEEAKVMSQAPGRQY
jgi:hypothetical protein